MDHMLRNCPIHSKNERDNCWPAQPNPSSGPNESQKQNIFYSLQTRGEQEFIVNIFTTL